MCTELRDLEKAMQAFTTAFEPALLSASQAEVVMERAARIEHMGATLKALAAARLAQTELWATGGDRSPAHMLARRTGGTVSGAAAELEAARKLRFEPATQHGVPISVQLDYEIHFQLTPELPALREAAVFRSYHERRQHVTAGLRAGTG